ncbi:MAG: hypothetical protein A2Y38_14430 [Spirochaetes bacterium GWB1_59_5]|nr:MAG: hypothetical protein A2Y38_14430 [Spirochaetes bacterium GWB1_59_5]
MTTATTNPFRQIREAAQDLLAGVPDLKVKGAYNGEDWAALASIVARDGSCAWVRIIKVEPNDDSPVDHDCAGFFLHIIVGAGAIAGRALAAENAEQLVWDCYAAARGETIQDTLDWLHDPLEFAGIEIEHQTPNCTVTSLLLKTSADLGQWEETA